MTAAIPDGPLDSRPDGYATAAERDAILRQLLTDANVRLGAYDEVTVRWLVNTLDWWTFAGVASLIRQAARE
ncbi:hypothetical protein [Streptomyces sp. NPDC005799]|uniref:hypothetical protein n=1 Tax=Streptomyces sp. NPDC005799 TaxID=3154678 RepID=UPI0033C0B8A2